MNSQSSKVKVFFATAFILTSIAAILYALSYLVAGDGTDYFISGHPLPMLAKILSVVSVAWFACALILIPKDTLPTDDCAIATGKPCALAAAPIVGSLAAGTISLTYIEPSDLLHATPLNTTTLCGLLAIIGMIFSIVYYLLRMINSPKLSQACVILGAGPAAMMTGLCGLTYFELDHHMNAPAKVGMQLAWIATMLFLICELRMTLGKAQPRRYLAFVCIAFFANACAATPAFKLLTTTADPVHKTRLLGFALLCVCNCIYVGYRLIQFSAFCRASAQPDSPDTPAAPDQTQGKDDQDGCQQQDTMAS